jgi:hypothetical protein|tara:strand:+ start:39 stop:791 length:753 start_codon:yes stop_codon:yes gene_type:complete
MPKFTKFFSTDSAKAIKANNYGYLNAINYMAQDDTGSIGYKKYFTLCPDSTPGCRSLCLGKYSGQAALVKDLENGTNTVRESRKAKAQWFMSDRSAFMAEMSKHIEAMTRKAHREDLKLCVRPNGSTDIAFEYIKGYNGQSLPDQFPDIQFVDYTKNLKRLLNPNRPSNYHLTFSLSETNKREAERALANRKNVAVVFGHGQPETFMGHRVIDGTEHDLRHLDPAPVIVGLDPKGSKAKNDKTGFVVRGY